MQYIELPTIQIRSDLLIDKPVEPENTITIDINTRVNFGKSITGIKGFFSIVTMSTDTTTNQGGTKELFAVSTEFAVSPR